MLTANRRSTTQTHWPLYTAYQQAIRHPKMYFDDPALKAGAAEVGMYGLPETYSGNFGCVFKYNLPNRDLKGLKCFSSFLKDREQRYGAVREFHDRVPSSFMMDFEYRPSELFVEGQRYPLLMMEWIQGKALDVHIDRLISGRGDPGADLGEVASEFAAVVRALDEAHASHGDLQHGNIMITPGGIRLVDLDGMFVPAIAALGAVEMGLRDYQHPKRDVTVFGPELDRFSALVIYLSIQAVREEPELWDRFHEDLNLIFRAEDFKNPARSEVFQILAGMKGEVARLTAALERACDLPPLATPPLTDLLQSAARPIGGLPEARTVVTDVTGREVMRLACALQRVGPGRFSGSLTFNVHNLSAAPNWVTVSSNLPGLDLAGQRAFLVEAEGQKSVTCAVSISGPLGPKLRPNLRISSGRWHTPESLSHLDIGLDIIAVGLRTLEGADIVEFQRRFEDLDGRGGGASLPLTLENLGNVRLRVEPSVKQGWLRLSEATAISLAPAEQRAEAISASLVGVPPMGAMASISFKIIPADGGAEIEESVRLKILDRPTRLIDRLIERLPEYLPVLNRLAEWRLILRRRVGRLFDRLVARVRRS
jgi:hypothetical protein